MREQFARWVCGLSLASVIALAGVFALRNNPRVTSPPAPLPPSPTTHAQVEASAAQVARGRVLFAELECTTCHSFRGQGNPRRPLDDTATRRSREELSSWITGTGAATAELSPTVLKRKQPYQSLAAEDLSALVALLSSPTAATEREVKR